MKKQFRFVCAGVFIFVVAAIVILAVSLLPTGAATTTPSATLQTKASTTAASKEACLNCHGPFDKLAASANYQAPSGEKITPHRYVPHNAKEAKAIPECSNCHEPHPVPPTTSSPSALPGPDVQWCYTTCHHKNNFRLCADCHK